MSRAGTVVIILRYRYSITCSCVSVIRLPVWQGRNNPLIASTIFVRVIIKTDLTPCRSSSWVLNQPPGLLENCTVIFCVVLSCFVNVFVHCERHSFQTAAVKVDRNVKHISV